MPEGDVAGAAKRAASTSTRAPEEAVAKQEREPDANDLAAAAAAAGGETWRAYAAEALAQVQQLEEEAERRNCKPEELLRRSEAE